MSFWDKFWSLISNADSDNYALLDIYYDDDDEDEMMALPEKRPTLSVPKNSIYFVSVFLLTFLVFFLLAIVFTWENCGTLNFGDWKSLKNGDISRYIRPENKTTVIEPEEFCEKHGEKKLLVLILVCSAVNNFEQRQLIRDTWGSYENYDRTKMIIKYANHYNVTEGVNIPNETKLNASESFEQNTTAINNIASKDQTIIMKENFANIINVNNTDFKLLFFVGLPNTDAKNKETQQRIENESKEFQDIVQEEFIDTCRNLTLKSVMMLKWVLMSCRENVRYVFKVEDDTFVNMHNLVQNLRCRAKKYDCSRKPGNKEYLMIGHMHCELMPDRHSWFWLPIGMHKRNFPRFLSGEAGYVMSMPAAAAVYLAAQTTPYIALEDVFVTGYCALRSIPRLVPHNDRQFCDLEISNTTQPCAWYDMVTAGHGNCTAIRRMHEKSLDLDSVLRCKNLHLTRPLL